MQLVVRSLDVADDGQYLALVVELGAGHSELGALDGGEVGLGARALEQRLLDRNGEIAEVGGIGRGDQRIVRRAVEAGAQRDGRARRDLLRDAAAQAGAVGLDARAVRVVARARADDGEDRHVVRLLHRQRLPGVVGVERLSLEIEVFLQRARDAVLQSESGCGGDGGGRRRIRLGAQCACAERSQ